MIKVKVTKVEIGYLNNKNDLVKTKTLSDHKFTKHEAKDVAIDDPEFNKIVYVNSSRKYMLVDVNDIKEW